MLPTRVYLLALAVAFARECGGSRAVLASQRAGAVVTSKSRAIRFVAVDGHSLSSPQQQIKISSGRHVLHFRVSLPLLGWRFPGVSDEAYGPFDYSFEANHHYTVDGRLSRTGSFTLLVTDEDKRPRAK